MKPDAVQLLSKGIKGRPDELLQAVRDYQGHAFSLNLLANYLQGSEYQSEILQRDHLPNVMHSDQYSPQNWRAQQILVAYASHWQERPELVLLTVARRPTSRRQGIAAAGIALYCQGLPDLYQPA
ncbi:MAG: hypothetical protein R3E89_11705 [Thiolinea sp.]